MASLRRFGSRLTKKKTTKLRHSIVSSMTPRRRRMNASMPAPLRRWRPAPHFHVSCPRACAGGGSRAPPATPELGFVQPDLVELQLEGLMHEQPLHVVRVVAVERTPERLDQDARVLKDRLDV